jgi:hypothetical protein
MANSSLEGFIINGIAAVDVSGYSVSNAGDINGDGTDDLIIGANLADPNGSSSGQSYVVFGSSGFTSTLNLSTLNGSNGFKINGIAAGDQAGYSVSGAGDVNGDGINDVIIGANRADSNGEDAGQSYVLFGSRSGFVANFNLSTLNGSNGFKINGIAAGDRSGTSVSRAGDINGDGTDDLIIGARSASPNGENSGQSYVVFGKPGGFSTNFNLANLNGTNGFILDGVEAGDNSGVSVSEAGDVNGDGIDDLVIGASDDPLGATPPNPGNTSPGQSYVVFGKRSGFSPRLNLSTLNGSDGFKVSGITADDRSGYAVSTAGDINGDGIDDVLVGSYFASPNGVSYAGQSYVVFGKRSGFSPNLDLADLNGSNGFKINGIAELDVSGAALSSAGDVNGDGLDDLLIGAPYASPDGKFKAGQSYVVFGSRDGFGSNLDLADLNGSNGFKINGILAGDIAGVAVSSAGDVNGDGIDDLVIGAAYASPNGNINSGQSYVVFGRVGIGSSGTFELSQLVSRGTPGNDTLFGTSSDDTLLGEGGDDILVASDGNDTLDGGSGSDTADYSKFGQAITLEAVGLINKGSAGTDTIFGIETIIGATGKTNTIDGSTGTSNSTFFDIDLTANRLTVNDIPVIGAATFTVLNFVNVTGTSQDDSVVGNAKNNVFVGEQGNDTLVGEGGQDTLIGGDGNDTLTGGGGRDTLIGGNGLDSLRGGNGADRFRFLVPNEGIDTILDFVSGTDKIELSLAGFGSGLSKGMLATSRFVVGTRALDANDRLIYNAGRLFFDRDGSGGASQVQLASLNAAPSIVNSDIMIV